MSRSGLLFVLSFFSTIAVSSSPQFLGYVGIVPFSAYGTLGTGPLSAQDTSRGNFEKQRCKSRSNSLEVAHCIFRERGIAVEDRTIRSEKGHITTYEGAYDLDSYFCSPKQGTPDNPFIEAHSEHARYAVVLHAYACMNSNEVPIPKREFSLSENYSPTEAYPGKAGFDYGTYPYLFTCGPPRPPKQEFKIPKVAFNKSKTTPEKANGLVGLCGSYGLPAVTVGNPIVVTTGNKVHIETDYEGAGPFPLLFQRTYNSQAKEPRLHWQHTYERHLFKAKTLAGGYAIEYVRGDGQVEYFNPTGATTYRSATDSTTSLVEEAPGLYRFQDERGNSETVEDLGNGTTHLLRIQNAQGFIQTLSYDGAKHLKEVSDPFGRTLEFEYDANGLLVALITPARQKTRYHYDAQKRLVQVTRPDGSQKSYHYEDAQQPFLLTGITDPLGKRIATWAYDVKKRAILSEGAGGIEHVALHFDDNAERVSVLDALGKTNFYGYQSIQGVSKPTVLEGGAEYGYDARGFLTKIVDPKGTIKQNAFDKDGMLQSTTEAAGREEAYTTRYGWHPQFKTLTYLEKPGLKRLWGLNVRGQITSETQIDTILSTSRTHTYQYDDRGLLTRTDGPRLDAEDVTNFAYDPQGNLIATKNPLGHTVRYDHYNLNGRPQTIVDENGKVTTLRYNVNGLLTEVDNDSAKWKYHYNANDQLVQIENPLQQATRYTYDEAHRLTSILDTAGQKAEFSLSPASLVTRLALYSVDDALSYQQQYNYNDLGKLIGETDGNGLTTSYQYDVNGYVTLILDAKKRIWKSDLDVFNHPLQVAFPDSTQIELKYNPEGQLLFLTDTLGHTTRFTYNGFGALTSLQSVEAGQTQFQYNEAGLLKSTRYPDGHQAYFTYDALNRPTAKTFDDKQHAVQWRYDGVSMGIGSLTSLQDDSGTTHFSYDKFGNVIGTLRRTSDFETSLQWTYNLNQEAMGIRYPSGNWVEYTRDAIGQVQNIRYQGQSIVTGTNRLPAWGGFSPILSYQLGNGIVVSNTYDKAYMLRKTTWTPVPNAEVNFQYDATYNLAALETSKIKQSYQYDLLDRLISENFSNPVSWVYDALGNRLSERKSTLTSYRYHSDKAHLAEVGKTTVTQDAAGRVIQKGDYTFTYGSHQQLSQVSYKGQVIAEHTYNAQHQRTKKVVYENATLKTIPKTTYFVYDLEGHLIAELDDARKVEREYVYLDNAPVALVEGGVIYYFLNSKLGAPLLLTDAKQQTVWEADYAPFGEVILKREMLTQNLRFPGQYYDAESGLHYNWHRYYDPTLGRYLQPDPIGLAGGINLYAYAGNNPLRWVDPDGLFEITVNDPGGRNGPAYGGTITVTGDNGQSVTVPASSWPNPTNPNPGISPGTYPGIYSPSGHQGRTHGVRVNNGGRVPTLGPNPTQRRRSWATGVNIHCGYRENRRGSAGCITIEPGHCQSVWDVLHPGETGSITIRRGGE